MPVARRLGSRPQIVPENSTNEVQTRIEQPPGFGRGGSLVSAHDALLSSRSSDEAPGATPKAPRRPGRWRCLSPAGRYGLALRCLLESMPIHVLGSGLANTFAAHADKAVEYGGPSAELSDDRGPSSGPSRRSLLPAFQRRCRPQEKPSAYSIVARRAP